jgi:hypothetical protein
MDLYEFIILLIGMAFFGIVPPFLVGWYIMKKGQLYAENRTNEVLAYARQTLSKELEEQFDMASKKLIDNAVDRVKESLRDSLNGYMGNKVSQLKKTITQNMENEAGPLGKILGDLAGSVAEDYGYGKKKIVSNGVMALFRKGKGQPLPQDQVDIQSYLPPEAPKIIEEFNRQ